MQSVSRRANLHQLGKVESPHLGLRNAIARLVLIGFLSSAFVACSAQPGPTNAPQSTLNVEDWFGESQARIRIGRIDGKATTLVLADDIDFSGRKYSYQDGTAPKNVIIVADTIRLNDIAQFDLSAPQGLPNGADRSGGELVVFARHVICQHDGHIIFRSTPNLTPAAPFAPTGLGAAVTPFTPVPAPQPGAPFMPVQNGVQATALPSFGTFLLGFESLELSQDAKDNIVQRQLLHDPLLPGIADEPLRPEVIAGLLSLVSQTYDDVSIRNKLTAVINQKTTFDSDLLDLLFQVRRDALSASLASDQAGILRKYLASGLVDADIPPGPLPKPTAGIFRVSSDATGLIQYEPAFKLAISQWSIRWLSDMLTRIAQAKISDDRGEMFHDLDRVHHLPHYPIDASLAAQYNDELAQIQKTKDAMAIGLNSATLSITTLAGNTKEIDVFSEGTSVAYSVAPTNVLLREDIFKGIRKIGLCRFDPNNPHEVEFYFTADLTVDPALAVLVRDALTKRGDTFEGAFNHWKYTLSGFDPVQGLIAEKSSVSVNGSVLQGKLVFADSGVGLLQWSTSGIPIHLQWQYDKDPQITGTLDTLLLKRTTRADPQITVSQGQVSNNGAVPVRLRYGIDGQARIVPFSIQTVPQIDPGKQLQLQLPAVIDVTSFRIPPEAVEAIYASYQDYGQDFQVITSGQLAEQITVSNSLTANAVQGQATIESVDVTVLYDNGDPGGDPEPWSISLLPSPSPGATVSRWFYKSNQQRTVKVSGKVRYSDGSYDDLKPWTEASSVVRIGLESIQAHNQ